MQLVPLTMNIDGGPFAGVGWSGMLKIATSGDAFAAQWVSLVGIFHCAGARDPGVERRLREDQAALFFDPGGRPGPRRRLRRRRPFFARGAVDTLPSNDWIAERTSCCTRSRITVSKLFCLGIESSLPAADTRMPDHQQRQ
jgi:hypothetical protein